LNSKNQRNSYKQFLIIFLADESEMAPAIVKTDPETTLAVAEKHIK
jgi:hypothetical protein